MALSAVTFDLWQTLIMDTPDGLRKARADRVSGVHAILAREGHRVDLAAVDAAYDAVGARLGALWTERRDVGSRVSSSSQGISLNSRRRRPSASR